MAMCLVMSAELFTWEPAQRLQAIAESILVWLCGHTVLMFSLRRTAFAVRGAVNNMHSTACNFLLQAVRPV
jgi:hypothetical protein